MEEAWLRSQLESGRSIESIARETGRAPRPSPTGSTSTASCRRARRDTPHAAASTEKRSQRSSNAAFPIRDIARELDRSGATSATGSASYSLRTQPRPLFASGRPKPERACYANARRTVGRVFVRIGAAGRYRCGRCNGEAVSHRRRRTKAILIAEAGGAMCHLRLRALRRRPAFHHLDPAEKSFALATAGSRGRSKGACRGREVRARVRELSCGARGRARYYCSGRPCR